MPNTTILKRVALAAALTLGLANAHAAVRITEVAPWSSGNSPVGADWFELTNTGASAIDITGWKVDDNSNSFASALALNNVTSIAAGQSLIFVEGNAATAVSFSANWFGANVPTGFAIGFYSGAGIGLSSTSDAVNIFNSSGVVQASVSFGASDTTSPFHSFDNAAGLNNAVISQLSVAGVNGAFAAASNLGGEIGSPGVMAAVPEPETYALLLAGLGVIATLVRKSRR